MWEHDDDPPTPVDPWAVPDEPTVTLPVPEPGRAERIPQTPAEATRTLRRPVYGAVYVCRTPVDPRKYVGKSGPRKTRDGRRLVCAPGKRVDEHRDKQPWGHEILPDRAGYRVVEWVEKSGNGEVYDAANLRYREACWIQQLNPTENDLRPVPVPPDLAVARADRRRVKAGTVPVVRTRSRIRRRRVRLFPIASLAFWWALFTALLAVPLSASPAPWVPWVVAPAMGLAFGWATLFKIRKQWRRLTR
jgi:hypothetical protein